MNLSGPQVRSICRNSPNTAARVFKKSLSEWYPNVTVKEIKDNIHDIIAGKKALRCDVIRVIIEKWFEDGIQED